MLRLSGVLVIMLAALPASAQEAPADAPKRPKNVIVMIADGAGYNSLAANRLYNGKPLPHDAESWLKLAMATYSLRQSKDPGALGPLEQDPEIVYDPAEAWDTTPVEGQSKEKPAYLAGFKGYEWLRHTKPDSANTMSAIMTGVRSYNGAINVDGLGRPVSSVPEAAKLAGKSTGSLSTVPFNHATVASGGGAHNKSRDEYHLLAYELFGSGVIDVIGGGGNPDFDANGRDASQRRYRKPDDPNAYMPADLWSDLKNGENKTGMNGAEWTLVESKEDIEAIAAGEQPAPDRLAMIPEVYNTLQQSRVRRGSNPKTAKPGEAPMNDNVPTLATMARAALRVVGDDPDGFFLQIESGAVDWAMHANQLGRVIEEYDAMNEAVQAVVDYLDDGTNGADWSNTLVVVTADHDHMLFGSDAATVPYQDLVDNGPGELPGHLWFSDSHSNRLVPLFARGVGAEGLMALADEEDSHDQDGHHFGRGKYLTQAELGKYLISLVEQHEGPTTAQAE